MEHVIESVSPAKRFLDRLDIRGRIKRLPLPIQVLVNYSFLQLLALSIAIPDIVPLLDEALAGWLCYMGITATAASVRERYGDRFRAWRMRGKGLAKGSAAGALPDLDNAEELDPSIIEMTLAELEGMDPDFIQQAIADLPRG